MNGAKKLLQIFVMGMMVTPSGAQLVPYRSQDMEDLLYRDESAILPESETPAYGDSAIPLLHLNTAPAEELESSGLLTPYQVHQLVIYRERFGPLYSIHELAALPGFHPNAVKRLESLVSISMEAAPVEKAARHMALLTLERSYPASEESEKYAGSLLKTSLRIRARTRPGLALGLSYEKDAGEAFAYRNRPQFLSGYLSFEGNGFLKHLVAGNFQLNQGLGLVNGSGFLHRAGDLRITRKSFSRIHAYASLTESRYDQGLACRVGTQEIQCMLWASCHRLSLSPSTIKEHPKTEKWLAYPYSSGLFRTLTELENRDMAHRIHTGIQFCYRNRGLSLGILSGGERVLPGKKALDMLEKTPVISWHHNLSLHGNWYRNRIQVFGELAASGYSSLALLLGARYQFNDFIQGILHLHHYGSGYRGSLPSSYASGSQIRNEHGLAFHLFMESGRSLIIKLNGELFRYPAPRYLTEVPSEGFRLDLSLENPGNKTIYWRARLTSKIWQTTPALGNSPIRPLLNSSVHRIDGKLACEVHDRFRWLSRFVLGYCVHKQHASTGYAAVQQLTCHAGPVVITAQCVLFHIEDWANRIYLHEPGFYYSFNFPVYNGSGQKSILLLTCKPLNALKVSFKISHTRKQGNHHVASGIQLRVSF